MDALFFPARDCTILFSWDLHNPNYVRMPFFCDASCPTTWERGTTRHDKTCQKICKYYTLDGALPP